MSFRAKLKHWLDIVLGDAAQRAKLGPRKRPPLPKATLAELDIPKLASKGAIPSGAELDAYIATLSKAIRRLAPSKQASVVITGAMRCGKTRVAQQVCRATGMVHLPSDRLRNAIYLDLRGAERAQVVQYLYKRLIRLHPTGVVFDGTVFLDTDVDLIHWTRAQGIKVFAIGCVTDDAERKARSMIRFRNHHSCWTNDTHSNDEMRRLAGRIIRYSQALQQRCTKERIPFYNIAGNSQFERQLTQVTGRILRRMQVHPAQSDPRARPAAGPVKAGGQPAE